MKFPLNIFPGPKKKKNARQRMPEEIENSFFQKQTEAKEKNQAKKALPQLRKKPS